MLKNIVSFFTLWSIFCSCSDFLEPKSPSEYVPKSINSLNEMLLGSGYPTANAGVYLFAYHNVLDDDVEITDEPITFDVNNIIDYEGFKALFSWDPQMHMTMKEGTLYKNIWSGYYKLIMATNAALDYLDDVSGTPEEKNYVKGQALALRAFYYLQLVNLFGEPYTYNKQALGVPLKLVSALSAEYDERNTVEEVYTRILTDLDGAEKAFMELPAEKQFDQSYRINLPGVQLLKARVHLYMGDLVQAGKYAKKVIEDWNFSLYDLRTFIPTVQVPYPDYVSFENPETIWAFGSTSDLCSFMGLYGYKEDGKTIRRFLAASKDLLGSFLEGDLRKERYIVKGYENNQVLPDFYRPIGKAVITSVYSIVYATEFALSFRLSEAYLILAEAMYKTDPGLSVKLINDLREKRISADKYVPENLSGESLLDLIRAERRKELCFEGHRWFDLRRNGMPEFSRAWKENGVSIKECVMEKEDAAYTLPIPQEVMERNPGLKQNRLTSPKL